jgi:hypothetical protein
MAYFYSKPRLLSVTDERVGRTLLSADVGVGFEDQRQQLRRTGVSSLHGLFPIREKACQYGKITRSGLS